MAADRCVECDLGLFAFVLKYSGKPKDLVDLCISHKLILHKRICDKCGNKAVFSFDKKLWRCQKTVSKGHKKKTKCSWQESIYKNTFYLATWQGACSSWPTRKKISASMHFFLRYLPSTTLMPLTVLRRQLLLPRLPNLVSLCYIFHIKRNSALQKHR